MGKRGPFAAQVPGQRGLRKYQCPPAQGAHRPRWTTAEQDWGQIASGHGLVDPAPHGPWGQIQDKTMAPTRKRTQGRALTISQMANFPGAPVAVWLWPPPSDVHCTHV